MMDTLAPNRHTQLNALLEELAGRPTYEVLVRGAEVIGFDPNVEEDVMRIDAAMAASWANYRMRSYLERLRALNQERMEIGEEISHLRQYLKQHPHPASEADVEAWVRAKTFAPHLAGRQEVVINFFCISIQHIRSLLRVSAEAVNYELPSDDDTFLDDFRFLRNHFEHWYSRLPGKEHEVGLITKTVTADEYHVQGGLHSAGNDQVTVIDPRKVPPETHVVDVSNAGVARVERIAQETNAMVKKLVLQRVGRYFVENPDRRISSPQEVSNDPIIDIDWHEEPK